LICWRAFVGAERSVRVREEDGEGFQVEEEASKR
jgi:hypothetical protein